mmetsp:Transcript_95341/g.199448  ORF Transcript_95341/g.199448 Transcript_95341/m.199448 type:complete len:99 (+) Transcript_95341:136-432(+)
MHSCLHCCGLDSAAPLFPDPIGRQPILGHTEGGLCCKRPMKSRVTPGPTGEDHWQLGAEIRWKEGWKESSKFGSSEIRNLMRFMNREGNCKGDPCLMS